MKPAAQLLDLDLAASQLLLEVAHEVLVGRLERLDLLRDLGELRPEVLLGLAQTFDLAPERTALEAQTIALIRELFDLADQPRALAIEALRRRIETLDALFEPGLVALQSVSLGDHLVVVALRHATRCQQGQACAEAHESQADGSARRASADRGHAGLLRSRGCVRVLHRSSPHRPDRALLAALRGFLPHPDDSCRAAPPARYRPAWRRAPSP